MKKITAIISFIITAFSVKAQNEAYRGGSADGHAIIIQATAFGNANVFQPYFGGVADGHSLVQQVTPFGNADVFQPYFGGSGDGHTKTELISFSQYAYINMFSPFAGGNADGHANDSIINFPQHGPALLFSPFAGGPADGHAADSVINFAQYNFITMFSPYVSGKSDGHAADSAITFNQHGYITMFQPYAGGQADGWAGQLVLGISVVPVGLLDFTGEQVDKKHLLHWTTTQEQNSAYFDVQRSADAQNFKSLGNVTAAGNSSTERKYNYTDAQPMLGNNFYRLRMTDINGSYKYSNIILLKMFGDRSTITVYPNPATKTIFVNLGGANDNSTVNATVFDASGRYVQSITLRKTNASFSFDVERLPAGTYSLRIQYNNEISSFQFIKH